MMEALTPMDKTDWEKVERCLKNGFTYATVKLLVDGYTLTIQRVRVSETRDAYRIYINGEWLGKWLLEDCEERRRFHQQITRKAFTGKYRKVLEQSAKTRGLGSDYRNKCRAMLAKTVTRYTPFWCSVVSLKRHLIKHNKTIALIEA